MDLKEGFLCSTPTRLDQENYSIVSIPSPARRLHFRRWTAPTPRPRRATATAGCAVASATSATLELFDVDNVLGFHSSSKLVLFGCSAVRQKYHPWIASTLSSNCSCRACARVLRWCTAIVHLMARLVSTFAARLKLYLPSAIPTL